MKKDILLVLVLHTFILFKSKVIFTIFKSESSQKIDILANVFTKRPKHDLNKETFRSQSHLYLSLIIITQIYKQLVQMDFIT